MGLKERQAAARKICEERGWTMAMSLEDRRKLSAQEWQIYEDAFSISDPDEMPAHVRERFATMIANHEAAQRLARGA